jgi:hypothetical protein
MKIIINIGNLQNNNFYVNDAAILNDIKVQENNKKLKIIIISTHFNRIIA